MKLGKNWLRRLAKIFCVLSIVGTLGALYLSSLAFFWPQKLQNFDVFSPGALTDSGRLGAYLILFGALSALEALLYHRFLEWLDGQPRLKHLSRLLLLHLSLDTLGLIASLFWPLPAMKSEGGGSWSDWGGSSWEELLIPRLSVMSCVFFYFLIQAFRRGLIKAPNQSLPQ